MVCVMVKRNKLTRNTKTLSELVFVYGFKICYAYGAL